MKNQKSNVLLNIQQPNKSFGHIGVAGLLFCGRYGKSLHADQYRAMICFPHEILALGTKGQQLCLQVFHSRHHTDTYIVS